MLKERLPKTMICKGILRIHAMLAFYRSLQNPPIKWFQVFGALREFRPIDVRSAVIHIRVYQRRCFVYKMTKHKAGFLGKNCTPVSICNSYTKTKGPKVWRTKMLRYLVFLVLLTSGKFCYEQFHVMVMKRRS